MKSHWVIMSGLRGFMPDYVESYSDCTKKQVVESILDMFEIDQKGAKTALMRSNWIQFDDVHKYGTEYIELMLCNCDNPEIHRG